MVKDGDPFELNAAAKQAIEQVHQAVDTYFDFLEKSVASFASGGTDLGEKMKTYAHKNIAATQQFIHRLSQAKDFQDVLRIQTEFMQEQMNALSGQTKNFGEEFSKSIGAVKPPFKM